MKKAVSKYRRHLTIGAAGLILGIGVLSTITTGQCTFVKDGELKTMALTGDCTTDETIFIPNGYTLYGKNYTIYVKDGDYRGAVIRNTGELAHVRYLSLELDDSFQNCQKLTGIMFDNGSGTIMHNNIFDVNETCNKESVSIIGNSSDEYVEIAFNNFGGDKSAWINVIGDIETVVHHND